MESKLRQLLSVFGLEYFDKYYGCYKGFVASNEDPENLGRLQLKVPSVCGNNVYEKWALPKGIYAGNGIGSYFIPNEGDTVWVSFEGGDVRFPIWEYGWWLEGQVPEGATPKIKVLQTTAGHRIEMDDENGLVRIKDNNDNTVELNSEGISIVSDSISLGSLDESAEPAVLGDTAVALLNEFITDLGNVSTIVTSSGVTSTINTSPQWSILATKWKTKWEEFNSLKVTLDKQ